MYNYNFNDTAVVVEPDCDGPCDDLVATIIYPITYEKDAPVDCSLYDIYRDVDPIPPKPDDFETRARAYIEEVVQKGLELLMSDHDGPIPFEPMLGAKGSIFAQTGASHGHVRH